MSRHLRLQEREAEPSPAGLSNSQRRLTTFDFPSTQLLRAENRCRSSSSQNQGRQPLAGWERRRVCLQQAAAVQRRNWWEQKRPNRPVRNSLRTTERSASSSSGSRRKSQPRNSYRRRLLDPTTSAKDYLQNKPRLSARTGRL